MAATSFFGERRRDRYGNRRHPDLPWGYWLVSSSDVPGQPPLIDEDGREWQSVRQAFCEGRLGMPYDRHDTTLDFMASYLAIADERFVKEGESVRDIFLGDGNHARFFRAFLTAVGLIESGSSRVSAEGRAVLMMLIATRTHQSAENAVGMEWIAANRVAAPWKERQEVAERVRHAERVAAHMFYRFATATIDGLPSVRLIGLHINKEIPVRSTLWSMSWPVSDTHDRNRFYLWLVKRIDRWDDWSRMATKEGTRALTEHFMKLAFCDRSIETETVTPEQN